MFRPKKRGLRSIKSTFIILTIIFLIPLIIAIVVNKYFSVPPIYPQYDEVIAISKSSENGYIYLNSADVIARRIYNNYIHTELVKYRPSSETENRLLFDYKNASESPVHFIALLDIYREYIKSGNLKKILSSVHRERPNKAIAITTGSPISNEEIPSKITNSESWENEFLNASEELLLNMKKANKSKFLIRYPFLEGQTYPVDIGLSWNIIAVALVNCVVNIENGNYSKSLDWLETITTLALRCYENSLSSDAVVYVASLLYANLFNIDYLPDWVYNDMFCILNHAKANITQIPFSKKFELILLMLEHNFRVGEESRRMAKIEKFWATFHNYRIVSKMLEENMDMFTKTTWDEIEDSIVTPKGDIIKTLNDIRFYVPYMYPTMLWNLSSGEAIARGLFCRNKTLGTIYACIFFSIVKDLKVHNMKLPETETQILNNRLSTDEINWFLKHSEITYTPHKSIVLVRPLEPSKEAEYRRINKIKNYPDNRVNYVELVLE